MQLQAECTRNMMRRKKKERHLKGETKRVNWSKENETELGLAVNIKDQNGSQG
jgi:glyceraldehyde-3-phosphate dehydrogenase/erythrose-4-phosphate dehydrogenase